MTINGSCDERFRPLEDAFRANFEDGLELGASLGVMHHGKLVADLWGGHADRKRSRPWQRDTIVGVFSTTKIATNIAILVLIDRGLIELDEPVARYWPQFAQGGKESVTVRDVLTHRAGVPGFEPPVSFEALHDWDGIAAHIAAMSHWFDGAPVACYHPITYGFIVGQLIRRVDGRGCSQFFREEIAQKAGADFHIGLASRADLPRVAELMFPLPQSDAPGPDPFQLRVMASVGPGDWSSWERLSAEIPASNGYGNGASIARLCAILAMRGQLDGVRYLSARMVEQAASEQVFTEDLLIGWVRYGLGFGLHSAEFPAPSQTCFHWGGFGGSFGIMDPKTGISCGYAPNNLLGNASPFEGPRMKRLWGALEVVLREFE